MADFRDEVELGIGDSLSDDLQITGGSPYRILVVGNLAGSAEGSVSGPLTKTCVEVNADTFDEVMAAACPSVSFKSTDPLKPGNVMVELDLRFDSLRAFAPEALVGQIPAAKSLMAAREHLVGRMRGKLSATELIEAVAAAAAAAADLAWLVEAVKWTPAEKRPTPEPGTVDDVLAQIDLGEDDAGDGGPPPKSAIGSIVAAAAGGTSLPAEEVAAIRKGLTEIDRRISAWLTAVLHAPPVQSIESIWRSVAFLVSRTEFRKGVRLALLHAPRADLMDRFITLVIDPVFDEGADAPDLIVVDAMFGNGAADTETLDELAQHAASLPAIALTGISPEFFGVKFAWQVPTLPSLINLLDQWQYAKWKSLRDQLYARFLGVVFGRCLLRVPHGREKAGDLDFDYSETCVTDQDFVWAGGAIAAACAAAHSVAERGWPSAMAGLVHGRVEGFVTAMGGKDGQKKVGPTDTMMPEPKIDELAAAGINAAVGLRDHDDAVIWNGLTAASVRQVSTQHGMLEISLPYQLFAARLSVLLLGLKPQLVGHSEDKIVSQVTQHVAEWLGIEGTPSGEQVQVQTKAADDDPTGIELAVTVVAPPRVLPGAIPVVLGYRVR